MLREMPCRLLHANPLVAVSDGFLSPEACGALIARAEGRLTRAQVGLDGAELTVSEARTNADCALHPDEVPEARDLMGQLARIVALPASHGEGVSVLHYSEAQEFKPHVDGIWSGAAAEERAAFEADGGQRLFTAMVYLNEVEAGGGTAFPKLGFRVAPQTGRLLIFANTGAGDRDQCALAAHAGEPVTAGEKWAAVTWWRERPYNAGS
ncbi:MAG: 2OG-Fe(II) oxygenase [Pseudomonadota bacterium]